MFNSTLTQPVRNILGAFAGLLLLANLAHAAKPVYEKHGSAIDGYDAVAYFTDSKPVKGDARISFTWNGATWLFASTEHRDLFTAAPEKYAPQYGGYCAYGVSEGHAVKIDPNAWTIVNGRLYLNYNLDVQRNWTKNRDERITKADANWPALRDK